MRHETPDIRLVSWDVDGTLFSYFQMLAALTRPVAQHAMKTGFAKTAREIREIWEFHRTVERQRRESNAKVVPSQLDRFHAACGLENRILQTALLAIGPRSRALSLLQRFSAARIPQVALSDFDCDYKLKALGLQQHFSAAYSCRNLGFWKPSPVPLATIQKDFGVLPGQHLHIGDRSDTDGAACASNGCHFTLIDRVPKPWKTFNTVCSMRA